MCKVDIELGVIDIALEFHAVVPLDDSANWSCVQGEQDWPKY